jgi:hypothetical protein
MNERIKQLWSEAAESTIGDSWEEQTKFLEKFAELIVKECISINRQRMFSDYEDDSHRVAHNNALLCANSDIFEHFGVKE